MKEIGGESREPKIEEPEMQNELPEVSDANLDSELIEKIEKEAEESLEELEKENTDKKSKWKTVKGEVEVEDKKVEVSFREKVIELPKHRQQETGIKLIRRRELLLPFPEGLRHSYEEDKADFIRQTEINKAYTKVHLDTKELLGKWEQNYGQFPPAYRVYKKFDNVYRFLTDGRFPSDDVYVHIFNLHAGDRDERKENIQRFKEKGLYFQEIFPKKARTNFKSIKGKELSYGSEIPDDQDGVFHMYLGTVENYGEADYQTPVFIFGDKNKVFSEYKNIVRKEGFHVYESGDEIQVPSVRLKNKGIKPLRWCHAECALVPTKRSLNVLFFETGDEDKDKKGEK